MYSEIYFKPLSTKKELPIRDVKATSIGKLISVRGIVMRSTEVKPMIIVATYSCDLCGGETYQPVCIEICNIIISCFIIHFNYITIVR